MADNLRLPPDVVVLNLIRKSNPRFHESLFPAVTLNAPSDLRPAIPNTSIVVSPKAVPGIKQGSTREIKLNRVNLAVLNSYSYAYPNLAIGASLYSSFQTLTDLLGMQFTQADVVDAVVVESEESVPYNTLQITAKIESLPYLGSHQLRVYRKPHISSVFTTDVLTGF